MQPIQRTQDQASKLHVGAVRSLPTGTTPEAQMSCSFGQPNNSDMTSSSFRAACGYFDRTLVDPREELHGEYVWHPGQVIAGRYHIVQHLGDGSSSSVYLATDQTLEKQVALKTSRYPLKSHPEEVEKFYREVAFAHAITHPNVVRIFDIDEADGQPFFSMEYLQGQTLEELIQQSSKPGVPRITITEVQDIIHDILSGLNAAHQVGIIHRDLKPANVMITERGAILMDFGVAGVQHEPGMQTNSDPLLNNQSNHEQGRVFGSPAYMAPELWDGATASVRTDLYACGIMIYQMLHGQLPFDTHDIGEYVGKMRDGSVLQLSRSRRKIPRKLQTLMNRLLAPNPDLRPASIRVVQQDIEIVRRNSQTSLALIGALVSVMLAALLAIAGFTLLYVPSDVPFPSIEQSKSLEF